MNQYINLLPKLQAIKVSMCDIEEPIESLQSVINFLKINSLSKYANDDQCYQCYPFVQLRLRIVFSLIKMTAQNEKDLKQLFLTIHELYVEKRKPIDVNIGFCDQLFKDKQFLEIAKKHWQRHYRQLFLPVFNDVMTQSFEKYEEKYKCNNNNNNQYCRSLAKANIGFVFMDSETVSSLQKHENEEDCVYAQFVARTAFST